MNGKLFYPVDISLKYWVETGGVFKNLWWRFLIAHIVDWQELTPETLLFFKSQKNLYIPLMFCPQSRLSSHN
jgi:hypothetical protein